MRLGEHVVTNLMRSLYISVACAAITCAFAVSAHAQADGNASVDANRVDASEDTDGDAIIITGSRIRRSSVDTASPVSIFSAGDLADRGFVQTGQLLNTITSISPSYAAAAGSGSASGSGQQYPNLFGLGAGRTLTLVNGRRMVTTATGLADRTVDSNIIPVGLLKQVEIVEAGGAVVYGSDAIAGVVNYVLRSDFSGLVLDAQSGITSHGDYPAYSLRATAGRNFADGRGNIAANIEWRKTGSLLFGSRDITNPVVRSLPNPLNTSSTDGISATIPVSDPHFWYYNQYGVISSQATRSATAILGQFSNDGSNVLPFNPGQNYSPAADCTATGFPFCTGGDGYPYANLAALYTGIKSINATVLGHYDITDRLKLSANLLFAQTKGSDPLGVQAYRREVTGQASAGLAAIPFTIDNPFLTSSAKEQLSTLYPAFASGGRLYLSKSFDDLLPTRASTYETNVYRGDIAIDGDFYVGKRDFYFQLAYSYGVVRSTRYSYAPLLTQVTNALDAVTGPLGTPICSINAVTVTDAACVPINPFGMGNILDGARAYATVELNPETLSKQGDLLATLGGDVIELPAGTMKFNVGYEHRSESARFTPARAEQDGLLAPVTGRILPAYGEFKTNEFSAELLVPVLANEFTIPLVRSLDLSAQYRWVDNSLAGKSGLWGAGAQLHLEGGLMLRGSRSRNFRAPSLSQVLSPQSTALTGGVQNPCDTRNIDAGPAPEQRRSYCETLFSQNPGWGPLSTFTDPGVNFNNVQVTSGGNPDLKNEISNTTTLGVVWQPDYIPGLTFIFDRIDIRLDNGLTAFTPSNFVQACSDASAPSNVCDTFTRDPATGYIATALNTTFNAALVQYKGDRFNLNYRFPLSAIVGSEAGTLELSVDATHNRDLRTVVAGTTTQLAGTTSAPDWVLRTDVRFKIGRFMASYQMIHLPKAKVNSTDTSESTWAPTIPANTRHSVSFSVDVDRFSYRVGVNNVTDRQVSFPTFNYGDLIGRQFFAGVTLKY